LRFSTLTDLRRPLRNRIFAPPIGWRGRQELDSYLHTQVNEDIRLKVASTHAIVNRDAPTAIFGF